METKDFEQWLSPYQEIKKRHVDPRLEFYEKGLQKKRRAAESSAAIILLLSLVIPVVANLPSRAHWVNGMIVSILSLVIAFISGIRELTQWAKLWRAYSQAKIQIEALIGAWEIEIARARHLTDPTRIPDILEKATTTLLASVDKTVLAEMGSFFDTTPKTPQHGEQTAAK